MAKIPINPFLPVFRDPVAFAAEMSGLYLRAYQQAVARAVCTSVRGRLGLSFVVMFPRQSGKNELQAQIEAFLLTTLQFQEAEIVKVSPTWKPQSLNAMRRLERVLEHNLATRTAWSKESGYIYRLGQARIFFLSGAPEANIVGATASALLEVDEAQDVQIAKFDKDIAPMAASTNATRVFWGTAWTSRTLLARELRAAREAEGQDGMRRAFVLTADEVGREVPAYRHFVAGQVARLGRGHPTVRTQFYSEEIDQQGGMFPPERLARMRAAAAAPLSPNSPYALLIDVAGEDESAGGPLETLTNPRRDSTALTLVAVDLSGLHGRKQRAPTYRPVLRRQWTGVRHADLFGEVRALAETWRARYLVVDATGVGAGLASFLDKALPGRVIPFLFNQSSKSKLGWEFLGLVDEGRWVEIDASNQPLTDRFYHQLSFCQYEVLPGPGKLMRWGVPDGQRDPASGEYIHDDLVISAALAAVLDELPWGGTSGTAPGIVRARDPLADMDDMSGL